MSGIHQLHSALIIGLYRSLLLVATPLMQVGRAFVLATRRVARLIGGDISPEKFVTVYGMTNRPVRCLRSRVHEIRRSRAPVTPFTHPAVTDSTRSSLYDRRGGDRASLDHLLQG